MHGTRLVSVGALLAGAIALVVPAGEAEAAVVPAPPGCGFTLEYHSFGGAGGEDQLVADAYPLSPAEHCSTVVDVSAAVEIQSGPVPVIQDNPAQAVETLTFTPGGPVPDLVADLTDSCATLSASLVFVLRADGQSVQGAAGARICSSPGTARLAIQSFLAPVDTGLAITPDGQGLDLVDTAGSVALTGESGPPSAVTDPAAAGMTDDPAAGGYWVFGRDGSVYSYGEAPFFGSAVGLSPASPIVGMAPTPDGGGYWLVSAAGGVFAFGDAAFRGSLGGDSLQAPVVAVAPTADGGGYWLAAADGGVFSFGDAIFHGSAGELPLVAPVVGMAADPAGGYWLAAADGGVFTFGPADFLGSAAGAAGGGGVRAIASTPDGHGYAMVGADGKISSFGDAPRF